MAVILYAWEYGADLGHVSVFLPIARQLRARGHIVRFSVPFLASGTATVKKLLTANDFEYIDVPGSYVKMSGHTTGSHAELLQQLPGFRTEDDFSFFLHAWLTLLDEEGPDIIVCDYAPVANLAARVRRIPRIIIDLGFFVPDPAQEFPLFLTIPYVTEKKEWDLADATLFASRDNAERNIINIVNPCFEKLNSPPLSSFSEIYACDKTLWLTYPELSPVEHTEKTHFHGAVLNQNGGNTPQWKINSFHRPKIFAYLKQGLPVNKAIVDSLRADPNLDVIIYIPACSDAVKSSSSCDHVQIESEPLDIALVLQHADLVICNAGAGLIAQTLLSGTPLLLAPAYLEQGLNTRRAVALGAALSLPTDATAELVAGKIYQILSHGTFVAAARAFQYKHKPADIDFLANEMIRCVPSSDETHTSKARVRVKPEPYNFNTFDVVFLSYDEPNADANWEHLKAMVPTAKRVHGVKGFDAAHKAAANAAQTERFILVDADNRVDPAFFTLQTLVPVHLKHSVWQWSSVNDVTGLVYPFGGVKVWTRDIVQKMRSHELCDAEDDGLLLDFWSQPAYQAFCLPYSRNFTNGSPYQAFRAAYRETAKIGDMYGKKSMAEAVQRQANSAHSRRLCIWMSVGADVENGYWSMLGARMGTLHCLDTDLNISNINAYDWFDNLWQDTFARIMGDDIGRHTGREPVHIINSALEKEVYSLGEKVRAKISKPPVLDMNAEQSRNFKLAMSIKAQRDIPLFAPFELQTDIC